MRDKTADLQNWQAQIATHADTAPDVYAFFNDEYAGHAPDTARRFKRLLGLDVEPGLPEQGRLF